MTDNVRAAELVRVESIDASFDTFVEKRLEVLAGLRPALQKQQQKLAGSRILDGSFTAIQQSIGCKPGMQEAAAFVEDFVRRSISDGFVAKAIEKHGVSGRLSVAPLVS